MRHLTTFWELFVKLSEGGARAQALVWCSGSTEDGDLKRSTSRHFAPKWSHMWSAGEITFNSKIDRVLIRTQRIENCLPGDFRPFFLTSKFSLDSPLSQCRTSFTSLQFGFLLFLLCSLVLLEIDTSLVQPSFSVRKFHGWRWQYSSVEANKAILFCVFLPFWLLSYNFKYLVHQTFGSIVSSNAQKCT